MDVADFRQATALSCPLGCGAHWCKKCNMTFTRGGIHSCDGQAEMDHLLGQKDWKKCPGMSPFLFSPPIALAHTCIACQVPVEKSAWRFPHNDSLLNCSVAQGCNHMTCRCNWYGLLQFGPPFASLIYFVFTQSLLLHMWRRDHAFHPQTRHRSRAPKSLFKELQVV